MLQCLILGFSNPRANFLVSPSWCGISLRKAEVLCGMCSRTCWIKMNRDLALYILVLLNVTVTLSLFLLAPPPPQCD